MFQEEEKSSTPSIVLWVHPEVKTFFPPRKARIQQSRALKSPPAFFHYIPGKKREKDKTSICSSECNESRFGIESGWMEGWMDVALEFIIILILLLLLRSGSDGHSSERMSCLDWKTRRLRRRGERETDSG